MAAALAVVILPVGMGVPIQLVVLVVIPIITALVALAAAVGLRVTLAVVAAAITAGVVALTFQLKTPTVARDPTTAAAAGLTTMGPMLLAPMVPTTVMAMW